MCAYTEVEKNSNKIIDAILRTDSLNKSFVQIRNAESNNSRNYALTKSVEPIGNPLSNSASKVKNRIIYTKSLSILKPTTAPINKNLINNQDETPTRKFQKPDYLSNKSLSFNRKIDANTTNNELSKSGFARIQKQKTLPISNENDVKKKHIKEYESLKKLQRNQIYALNNLMTKLEYANFIQFCQDNNIKLDE